MKILTKNKQEEILKRLVANHIIYHKGNGDMECIEHFVENEAEIAFLVGGLEGMSKVDNTIHKRVMAEIGGMA